MEIESEMEEISNFENLLDLREKETRKKKERESEMGEMKYQRWRVSCAATTTCDAYDISNKISPISFGGQGMVRLCLLLLVATWHHCPEQRRRDS